jgi:hypothetical protein
MNSAKKGVRGRYQSNRSRAAHTEHATPGRRSGAGRAPDGPRDAMIIGVSIVDKHRPHGQRHVGTYVFEIDYPAAAHPDQISFLAMDYPVNDEARLRPFVGKLLSASELPNPVRSDGTPL